MSFPKDFANEINESDNNLVEVVMINGDTEKIDENLKSWSVTKVSSTGIEISLDFEKAIAVSTGYSPDLLIIQIQLGDYTNYKGSRFPPSVIKKVVLPPQFSSQEEAETYS